MVEYLIGLHRAAKLQRQVRADEAEQTLDYTETEVRRAIVHTRQDLVVLVGLLTHLNLLAFGIVILLAVLVYHFLR
jgi:hypothetical protein